MKEQPVEDVVQELGCVRSDVDTADFELEKIEVLPSGEIRRRGGRSHALEERGEALLVGQYNLI